MLTNYIKKYPLSLFVAICVVVLSLMPFPEIELAKDVPLADKWTHMVMYGGLSLVIWVEYLYRHAAVNHGRTALWAILMPTLMGGVLELMQEYLTATRSGDWWDFIADAIGVVIAAVLSYAVLQHLSFHKR